MNEPITSTTHISRRTLAKGAAWAAPAVMVAAAAPAFAVSGPPPNVSQKGDACKSPGASCSPEYTKSYLVPVQICNGDAHEAIYLYSITAATSGTTLAFSNTTALPIRIPAGACEIFVMQADHTNSGDQVFDMTGSITWGHTQTAGADPYPHPAVVFNLSIDGTKPCKNCSPL